MKFEQNSTISSIFSQAVELTNDAIAIFDKSDVVIFCNPAFEETFGLISNPIGLTFADLIRHCFKNNVGANIVTEDIELWLEAAAQKRRQEEFRAFEADLVDSKWLRITELKMGDYIFLYATDVTASKTLELELKQTQNRLEVLASTDFLTGIFNRRHFSTIAKAEIDRCMRLKLHASLVLMDIDHFKMINDEFGHALGDEVLIEFSRRIESCLRPYDLFARVGGEEFAVLLPETDSVAATQVAKRYCKKISESPVTIEGESIKLTVSIGISESYPKIKTLDFLLKSADQQLYLAKESGRNKVVAPGQ